MKKPSRIKFATALNFRKKLKRVPQGDLNCARHVLRRRPGNSSEVDVWKVIDRKSPLNVIEGIEQIRADIKLVTFKGQRETFGKSKIKVFHAVHVKGIASDHAISEIRNSRRPERACRQIRLRSVRIIDTPA